MGLDTSHDCWHGAYSAFNRFRTAIASAIGIDLRRMDGFCDEGEPLSWDQLTGSTPPDPLYYLLHHSDCDGHLDVEILLPLAERLEGLIPKLEEYDTQKQPGGHLAALGTAGAARRFAEGCRRAATAGERVEFH